MDSVARSLLAEEDTDVANNWAISKTALAFAGIFAWTASFVAIYQIVQHIKYYDDPVIQRYYIRIIFLIPNLALASFFSLAFPSAAVYIETVRDMYEAFVIYTFMALLLQYIGGAGSVESFCVDKVVEPSWMHGTCCLPPMQVNGQFVRTCKQMVLQFVVVKPILAAMTIILYANGEYEEGKWGLGSPYMYIQLVYNVCYMVALLGLLQFYLGTKEPLRPYKPLMKFVLVKLVVFLTFWQGLFLSIVFAASEHTKAKYVQNWLICLEMFPAAIGMLIAFPYSDYKLQGIQAATYANGIAHVINIGDVVQDLKHQFVPMYKSYTCYNTEETEGADQTKKHQSSYRAKTFIMKDTKQSQIIREAQEGGEPKERGTNESTISERDSRAHLASGALDEYYPRISGSDLNGQDSLAREASTDTGLKDVALLPGVGSTSAPVEFKGKSKKSGKGDFDDVDL